MSKKMMLLAISVVSAAFFVMPAVASATSAHISSAAGTFTIAPNGATELETTGGEKVTCTGGVKGSGTFENTTTGNLNLTFHGCSSSGFSCNSTGQPAGTIATTALPFHLITIAAGSPGVLITPAAGNHFASFNCFIVPKTVNGNGVIGTITSPKCGTASTTAALSFEQGATGLQKHTTHTGVNYHLESGGQKAAQISKATLTFPGSRTLTCT
jgi:hypothetical protein